MDQQKTLFDPPAKNTGNEIPIPEVDRYKGAMVFAAVGDALGWPTEFLKERPERRPPFRLPVRDFVRWQKMVGGRWWGYRDEIGPGEYSDDTQLTLAVARSISSNGDFEPETFAYGELPLWLNYERGGGRSIKTAARTLIQRQTDWLHNFYKQGPLDYRYAGANGAAMRNLPIALSSVGNETRLIRDSFYNAIITHGHPRAILGTIMLGLAVRHAATQTNGKNITIVEYLQEGIENAGRLVADDHRIRDWVELWEKRGNTAKGNFKALFKEVRDEAHGYLSRIPEYINKPGEDYYRSVGAFTPATKGSGVGTVSAAIYLFARDGDAPDETIYDAVNMLGSDTDTIASFVGSLLGARYGVSAIPLHLWDKVQDRDYLLKTASQLHAVAAGELTEHASTGNALDRQEAYLRILAWDIGLHEMFWDAIDIGGVVVHPSLGRGVIVSKDVREISRRGYVTKLIHISFDCGQSCVFHSRVEDNSKVSESLGQDVQRAIGSL